MATVQAPSAPVDDSLSTRPNLKISGLHIVGLRSIKSLDLPQDGLGWRGSIPDFVLLGGVNGSGKTTFLEFLAASLDLLAYPDMADLRAFRASEAWIDFQFCVPPSIDAVIRFLLGDRGFI